MRLGRLDAWRSRSSGATLYVVPRSGAPAVVACLGGTSGCERVASTISVSGSLRFADLSSAAARADGVLRRLDGRRRAARARLGGAATPGGQAVQATALRTAFADAARELRGGVTSPLARALTRSAGAYAALERDAHERDAAAFARAARAVRTSEREVGRELAALRRTLSPPSGGR